MAFVILATIGSEQRYCGAGGNDIEKATIYTTLTEARCQAIMLKSNIEDFTSAVIQKVAISVTPYGETLSIDGLENIDLDLLFTMLSDKESDFTPDAYNKQERAAGIIQIRPGMLREVNRICRLLKNGKEYTFNDRYVPEKCREMLEIYLRYWVPRHFETATYLNCAHLWNGGSNLLTNQKYLDDFEERIIPKYLEG